MAPAAFATVCNDADEDGYITLNSEVAGIVFEESGFNPNGNYSTAEWNNYFEKYKTGIEGEAEECTNIAFKKGAEPVRCDAVMVNAESGVYDSTKVQSVSGKDIHPGVFDNPGDGIDQDCNGEDGAFIPKTGNEKDLSGLSGKVITYLSRAVVVVSIVFLIVGGMMYATAAGDETKTGRAKKTIIGAVIGLIVGLLAPSIVNLIVASLA